MATSKKSSVVKSIKGPGRRLALVLLAPIFSLLILASCTTTTTEQKQGAQLLNKALIKTEAVSGYHFESSSVIRGNDARRTVRVSGDWQKPGRLRMSIESGGKTEELLIANDRTYARGGPARSWQPTSSRKNENSTVTSTIKILKKYKSVALVDKAPAGTYLLRAQYDPALWMPGQATSATNRTTDATILIDKKMDYVLKISLDPTEIQLQGKQFTLETTARFSRFNKVKDIEVPN